MQLNTATDPEQQTVGYAQGALLPVAAELLL